tara:strand:+ start:450 stop:683 length:234 start_codon:yes stop_codon:yes gene_type:complete
MSKSEKLLKLLSGLVESGILSTKDIRSEILNNLKFKKEDFANKLNLVQRQEFEVLKKIVQKQEKEIKKILKKKSKRQ